MVLEFFDKDKFVDLGPQKPTFQEKVRLTSNFYQKYKGFILSTVVVVLLKVICDRFYSPTGGLIEK
jgi:hypothetical protein